MTWDQQVVDVLADGYDVHYGARSIKHEVERRVVSQVALAHEHRLIEPGCILHITTDSQSSAPLKSDKSNHNSIPKIKLQKQDKSRKGKHIDITFDNLNKFS